jgi:type I restriction enzyme, S subunit
MSDIMQAELKKQGQKWPMVKLGALEGEKGNFVDGPFGSNLKSSEYVEAGVPLIQLKNIKPNKYLAKDLKYVTQSKADSISRHSYKAGDICIAKLGAVGTACIIPDGSPDGVIVADVVRFRGDKSLVDYGYLCHYLNSEIGQRAVLKLSRGTTRIRTNLTDLKKVEISLPPLEEQKRIAAILDKADTIRRKRQQAIKLADDFLRAVFLDMFGDPVTNPKGWEVVEVETISNVQGGLQVSSKREPNPLTVPYLRVANVLRDRLDLSEIKEINVNDSELNRVRLLTGDILVVEGHGNPDEIGRAAIWDRYVEDIVHQNHLIRIRPDRSKISSIFLNDFINSSGGRTQMANASNTTSGLNTISTGIVKSTKTILPPLEVQAEYEKVVSKVRKFRMDMAQLLANEMEYLFSSLSQKAFSGEL